MGIYINLIYPKVDDDDDGDKDNEEVEGQFWFQVY